MPTLVNLVLTFCWCLYLIDAVSGKVTCKDQNGKPVDWFIIYKIPIIPNGGSHYLRDGYAYYYMDANNQRWLLSDKGITSNTQAVSFTLQQIYGNHKSKSVAYGMYNDETPDQKRNDSHGHTKGVIALDKVSGFWLIHSVPRFPADSKYSYEYPEGGRKYGQTFLCVTYPSTTFNMIGHQLMFNFPLVYDYNMPDDIGESSPYLAAAFKGKHVTSPPYNQSIVVKSLGGQLFTVFSKSSKFNRDIFHSWLAPFYSSDMNAETWQRQGPLRSDCSGKYHVKNIKEIKFAETSFKETKDHSKWGLTVNSGKQVVCIGDINRMHGQLHRGGGYACASLPRVWDAFKGIMADVEPCSQPQDFFDVL